MKFLTVSEMIQVERAADRSGHSYAEMMENAGRGLAEAVHEKYAYSEPKKILGLVGKGNNGGDTLVALALLSGWGWDCRALTAGREQDELVERAIAAGCQVDTWESIDSKAALVAPLATAVLLDGLLGTGIRLPLRSPAKEVLQSIGSNLPESAHVVAVDCPSGVDCSSGEAAAETLPAELTITMAAPKIGLYLFPAASYVGELEVVSIGLPKGLQAWDRINRIVIDRDWVVGSLPQRPVNAHKGTFGTVIVVAGSSKFVGAALMAGKAAFRSGAGLVTLACPGNVYRLLAGHFPEATWLPLPDSAGSIAAAASTLLRLNLGRTTAILLGPGVGLAGSTGEFIASLLEGSERLPPMVVDADGLKLLARIPNWPAKLPEKTILTPHPGEMSILSGLSVKEIQKNRLGVAEQYAKSWGHVVVLKGANTLIAAPDARTALIPVATPALARAGTGDVLAGLITGLRGQGLDAFEAAACGAWIHARAGLKSLEKIGSSAAVLAGDVLNAVVYVLGDL